MRASSLASCALLRISGGPAPGIRLLVIARPHAGQAFAQILQRSQRGARGEIGDGAGQQHQGDCRTRRSPESRSTSRRCRPTCRAQTRCRRPAFPRSSPGRRARSPAGRADRRTSRHRAQAACAHRQDERREPSPTRRNRMASDVPSDCTNASSVACGLVGRRSAPLSAAATALAERAAGSFSSISCVGRENLQRNGRRAAAPPRTSCRAAATAAFEEKVFPTFGLF